MTDRSSSRDRRLREFVEGDQRAVSVPILLMLWFLVGIALLDLLIQVVISLV